uniref:Cyanobacterial aminoacyl-tRNA synthetase CAAD domain-containing protein n=1 Tax=Salix viminalis TaxID=40686 RepID=A0A6N2MBZ5_SALVM
MASIHANLPSPPLLVHGKRILSRTLQKLPLPTIKERQNRVAVVARATGESSESSTSLSIVKSVKNIWDDSEDPAGSCRLGVCGALVAVWASANVITAVDKLPVIPSALEFIGIVYSSWFIYRYLLLKPNREELFQIINKSVEDILGQ